jgi:nitrogen PTS system EIIA component
MNPSRLVLGDLMTPAHFNLALTGKNRDAVLWELVTGVPEISDEPQARQTLLRALQEREQLHSTGIGEGIALPHARNALIGLVEQPVIVCGRHPQGIPFGALDDVPTRLFFLLVAPTVTQHLAVLARISRLLRDLKLRQQLFDLPRPDLAYAAFREAEARM